LDDHETQQAGGGESLCLYNREQLVYLLPVLGEKEPSTAT